MSSILLHPSTKFHFTHSIVFQYFLTLIKKNIYVFLWHVWFILWQTVVAYKIWMKLFKFNRHSTFYFPIKKNCIRQRKKFKFNWNISNAVIKLCKKCLIEKINIRLWWPYLNIMPSSNCYQFSKPKTLTFILQIKKMKNAR